MKKIILLTAVLSLASCARLDYSQITLSSSKSKTTTTTTTSVPRTVIPTRNHWGKVLTRSSVAFPDESPQQEEKSNR